MMKDSDRTRENGFNMKEGRFRLNIRRKLFTMRSSSIFFTISLPKKAAQRICGFPIPGSAQDQGGWGSDQPGLKRVRTI